MFNKIIWGINAKNCVYMYIGRYIDIGTLNSQVTHTGIQSNSYILLFWHIHMLPMQMLINYNLLMKL